MTASTSQMTTGSASVTIARPAAEVFTALSDVTRMGEWSPENRGGRWLDVDGPARGARFEGDNEVKIGPLSVKRWTTTSEVTAYDPPSVFEFVTEGHTVWRFELAESADGVRVTESFSHPATTGVKRLLYSVLGSRRKAMVAGMERTLAALKAALEG
ncbi:MAG: SRPBCC family protein [Acidimicrobiales bacterium]